MPFKKVFAFIKMTKNDGVLVVRSEILSHLSCPTFFVFFYNYFISVVIRE